LKQAGDGNIPLNIVKDSDLNIFQPKILASREGQGTYDTLEKAKKSKENGLVLMVDRTFFSPWPSALEFATTITSPISE